MDRDRNLLFGMVAVRLNKVTQERLAQVTKQLSKDPTRDLSQCLVDAGVLSEADRAAVQAEVDRELRAHGNDPEATLTACAGPGQALDTFAASLDLTAPSPGELATEPGAASRETQDEIPAVEEHPGRYRQIREYASGGMGRILLVHDKHIGRDVALKELLPSQIKAAGTRTGGVTSEMLTIPAFARFVQEAKVTGQLEHPSIVPVYELGYRPDGSLYYTMKMVRGRTLHEALKETNSLQERLALLTHFVDLCQAISYAHSRGVIHRDIKPKNVLVGEFGETVVIDWGIAKAHGKKDIHAKGLEESFQAFQKGDEKNMVKTMYGQALGSPYFMPPEQAEGKVDRIDERSDVYSLGAVLYTLLTGKLPYLGTTVREFIERVVTFPPKPVRLLEPDAPLELVAVCERAMQRNPDDRYQTAKELTDEINRFMSGALVQAYEYRFADLFKRFVRKHRTFLVTAGSALIVLIGVSVFSYLQVVKEKEIAIEQRNIAIEAEHAANEARDQAEKARAQEQVAKREAQQELYSSNIALSERCLDERRLWQARNLLAGCPEAFRQWEWGRLQYLCNADLMTLKTGGHFVAFLPDGVRVVLGSIDGTVSLQDLRTGGELRTFVREAGFGSVVALSDDGTRVAVNGDQGITIWAVDTGETLFSFADVAEPEGAWPHCMALSSDGTRLAARIDAKTVKVWRVNDATDLASLPLERNKGFTMALSPDGKTLLTGAALFGAEGWENVLVLRETDTGAEVSSHAEPAHAFIHSLAFAPGGTTAAIGTGAGVVLWEVETWQKQGEFQAPIYYPRTLAFSPDGTMLAAAGNDGSLTVWNVTAGQPHFSEKAHLDAVHAVAFSADGSRLATAGLDRVAKLWDVAGKREMKEFKGHNGQVFCAAFNAAGTRLATGDYSSTTKIWAIDSDFERAQPDAMDFCPSRGYLAGNIDNVIRLWDNQTGHAIRAFEGHGARVSLVAFNPDGSRLASMARESTGAGEGFIVKLWDVDQGAELHSLDTQMAGVRTLTFSPDGRYLAARGGSTLKLWDVNTGTPHGTFEAVHGFHFSPDGTHLVTGTAEGVLSLRNIDAGTVAAEFHVTTKFDLSLAFSPDGALFLAGNDEADGGYEGTVSVWDMETHSERGTLVHGPETSVTCMAFTPDGTVLATGGKDRTVKLWHTTTLDAFLTLQGHAGEIRYLQFAPDSKRLVTASGDGTFRLWDCETGRELITLQDAALRAKGENCWPSRALFAPDGRSLITLTEPRILPPVALHSFAWNLADYPGDAEMPLQERVEAYKRQYWNSLIDPKE